MTRWHAVIPICFTLLMASPARADDVGNAYLLCKIVESTGLSSECKVSGWGQSVDATIDMNSSEARKLCPQMLQLMADKGKPLASDWKLRIFSPYSGERPIASCSR